MGKLVLMAGLLLVLVGSASARDRDDHDWGRHVEARTYQAPELDWEYAAVPVIVGIGTIIAARFWHRG